MLQLYIDLASSRLARHAIQPIQLYSYTAIHAIQHTALYSVPQAADTCGPRRVARDAPQRRGAGGLQAGAAAAGADADLALPCAAAARRRGPHQRCDRRVAEGGQRATLNSCLDDYSN